MKIAYDHHIPNKESYFTLFQSTGCNDDYSFGEEQLFAAVQNSWHVVAAYDYGKLAGFGRIISDGVHHAFLVDIMVLPEYRDRGIGSNMIKLLLAECKMHRIPDVLLFSCNTASPIAAAHFSTSHAL